MQFRLGAAGDGESLHDLNAALLAVLQRHGIARDMVDDILLITEEIVSNALRHGGAGDSGRVTVSLQTEGTALHLEFRDNGAAFNPLEAPDPDLDAPILDRPIGGLGIHLVRELAESVYYRRESADNVFGCVLRSLPSPGAKP